MRSGQIFICNNISHQKMGCEMDEEKRVKIAKTAIVILFVGVPILVMLYDLATGGFLLVGGLYGTHRAFRWIGSQHLRYDERAQFHNANAAGKTILVQIVDDFGRELPPNEVERRLGEARSKADPKDTVVPVKFKVTSE
jgi:hypothetical protein